MTALIGGLFGAVIGFGLFLMWMGWTGRITTTTSSTPSGASTLNWSGLGVAATVGLVTFVVTGWPVGAVLAMAAAWWGPAVAKSRRRRAARIARTLEIATWTEQLRDVVSASAGINEALAATAKTAPRAMRPAVQDLARRIRVEDPDVALATFASQLEHRSADEVVAALRLTMNERGAQLSQVLDGIASAARARAYATQTIDASRQRIWRQGQIITGITVALMALIAVFQRSYLDAYNSVTGQIVLGVIGLVFGAGLRSMVRLAEGTEPPRILASAAEHAAVAR